MRSWAWGSVALAGLTHARRQRPRRCAGAAPPDSDRRGRSQPFGLDAGRCRRGIVAYEVQTRPVGEPITIFPNAVQSTQPCQFPPPEPFDYRPGDPTRVGNVVTFEVVDRREDGSYRLRVTR